jgi:hypothetical protein
MEPERMKLWVLAVAMGSFALGAYVAGRTRAAWASATEDEVEFRDGLHGLLVWGLAIIVVVLLDLGAAPLAAATLARGAGPTGPSRTIGSATEPFLALELDRLFRSNPPRAEY